MKKENIKNAPFTAITCIFVLIIGIVGLIIIINQKSNAIQSSPAVCVQIVFDGEYKIADGEWTERSNSVYNAVSDLYMYHIGESFGLDEAFDAVRKNLDMMKYLLHPNDYIATEYSTRQDKGVAARMDARYTISYMLIPFASNTKTSVSLLLNSYSSLSLNSLLLSLKSFLILDAILFRFSLMSIKPLKKWSMFGSMY